MLEFNERSKLILKELKRVGVSQKEIGDRYGVKQATVSRLKNSSYCPPPWEDRIVDMQEVYGVNANWWMYGQGESAFIGKPNNPGWNIGASKGGEIAPNIDKVEGFYQKIIILMEQIAALKLEAKDKDMRIKELEEQLSRASG